MQKIFLTFLLISFLFAAEGKVNVFTGDAQAEIFIDGTLTGKEQLVKYSLEAGQHYLQIKKNNKIMKAQTIEVIADKTQTIVIDNFVDYKTDIASRGAVDVEAMRVRDTRGNFAFGLYGGSPASGLSLKWWIFERFGLQAIGWSNDTKGSKDSRGGCRLLVMFNQSVYQDSVTTIYGALGKGNAMLRNSIDEDKNETYELWEGALGIEFKIASFLKTQDTSNKEYKHVVIDKETSPFDILFTELIIGLGEGLMKFSHFSGEIGLEKVITYDHEPGANPGSFTKLGAKFSGGVHIYF